MRRKRTSREKRPSNMVRVQRRDPEDRIVDPGDPQAKREKMLDKTIADSFPASDPPSSLPNPNEDSFSRNTHDGEQDSSERVAFRRFLSLAKRTEARTLDAFP